jgi:hypothetical protein
VIKEDFLEDRKEVGVKQFKTPGRNTS